MTVERYGREVTYTEEYVDADKEPLGSLLEPVPPESADTPRAHHRNESDVFILFVVRVLVGVLDVVPVLVAVAQLRRTTTKLICTTVTLLIFIYLLIISAK